MSNHRAVLRRPIVTEKASILREGNTYSFQVDPSSNKVQIRQAIESIFNVHVESVRTVNVPSKPRRQGIHAGRRASYKKAYVTLRAGDSIDALESA
mgnify:FL=1